MSSLSRTAVAFPIIVPNVSPEKTGEFRYPTIRWEA